MAVGVFTLEVEDEDLDLASLPGRVDRMLVDLVDDVVEHAGRQIEMEAPGSISSLVEVDGASIADPGIIRGQAVVTPAHEGRERGKTFVQTGSDPRDYPFFVHQGTGVFGEFGRPITVAPPGFMQIDFPDGRVRTHSIQGQEANPYVERAFEQTASEFVPIRISSSQLPSGGT